jgi:hypothetical protein
MIQVNPNNLSWDDGDDDPVDLDDDSTPASETAPKPPIYEDVVAWVEQYFLPIVRRRLNPVAGKGLSWDPQWWRYPEVVARFLALYNAWEDAVASDSGSAVSVWWVNHLEPHLRVILDGDTGPMSLAAEGSGWSGHPQMPGTPVPPEVRARLRQSKDQT